MEKIWLKSYPEGVPRRSTCASTPRSRTCWRRVASATPSLPAFSNMGTTLTYGQLDRMSRYFGAYLQTSAGLSKGDRVAIMMPNLLQYPVTLFGALRAGMTVVNVNPLYTARELQHQLADSGARAIVVLENFAHTLQEVLDRTAVSHVLTTRVGDLLSFPWHASPTWW